MNMRINKFLALAGLAARRKCDELIKSGKVRVNGQTAQIGQIIDTENDRILVNGAPVFITNELEYYALNKPFGVVSTADDELGRKNVVQTIKTTQRLYPIGRLDHNSTGLIILTNDGDLALKLTHPKYHLPKVYDVTTVESASDDQLDKMSRGVLIGKTKTFPAKITRSSNNKFTITLHQGMKRQIREMCRSVGLTVKTLQRTSIGPIQLGNLKEGQYRPLDQKEIILLKTLTLDNKN